MKTQTDNILPTYQVLGQVLRINFDEVQETKNDMQGNPHTSYIYTTAISEPAATRAVLVEAIIAAKHSPGEEISIINNQTSKSDEYAAYQAFRAQAKALSDGWLKVKDGAMQQSAETEVAQSKTQWIEANIYLTEVARLQSIKDEADAAEAAKVAAAAKSLADKAASDLAIKDAKDAADALVAENARLEAARVEALRIAEQLKVDAAAAAYALAHPEVPKAVTMRQARLALFNAGLLDSIDAAIAALPEPQKTKAGIEWNYSNEVDRSNGFVDALAPTLGITSEQIDALFIAAMTL